MWVIFLYLLKNAFIVVMGLFFTFILLVFNIYMGITTLNIKEFYLHFFEKEIYNILLFIFIYFLIYYILSLINYLFSSATFTNYYCFITSFILSSLHAYVLTLNQVAMDITTYFLIISLQIFLSFFINYSTKYENSNKNLITDTF